MDEAIALQPGMTGFLQQSMFESASLDESLAGMAQAMQQ
jgi:flagellum-specific ATP synthase